MARTNKIKITRSLRSSLLSLFLSLLILTIYSGAGIAQSTDRDNPTPLTTNEIRGSGTGKKVEYYYTFLAGPGEVVLTVDSGAKGSFSLVEVELFDFDAERIARIQNLPYGTTARKVERFKLANQQPLLLRVFLDRDVDQYLVRLGGAVQFETPNAAVMPGPTPVMPAAPATPGSMPETAGAMPESMPETAGAMPDVPSTPPPAPAVMPSPGAQSMPEVVGKVSGWQRQWLKLSPMGEIPALSGSGTLHIEMNDGTVQKISLTKVKKISVKEQ